MIRVADARLTRALNCRSGNGGIFGLHEKVRANFYMCLDRRHKNVDDCRKVRPVCGAKLNVKCAAMSPFFIELTSPRGKNSANTKPSNGPSHDRTSDLYDAMWC